MADRNDDFHKLFGWIGDVLGNPVPDCFKEGSQEHAILIRLKEGWNSRDIRTTRLLLDSLYAEYGEWAVITTVKFLGLIIVRDWTEIGKKEAGTGREIDDFIRVLWEPLRNLGFEFTVERMDGSARFRVTKCPVYEIAKETGLQKWIYPLSCATDPYTIRGFCPKVRFTRTKTLMEGHDCCDHTYY